MGTHRINWKSLPMIAALSALGATAIQQGPALIAKVLDANAWDSEVVQEVAAVKRVVEPIAKSMQSLALDRKDVQLDTKRGLYLQTTPDQVVLRQSLEDDAEELESEIRELKRLQKLPIFEPTGLDKE